jgi:hypothetical protein
MVEGRLGWRQVPPNERYESSAFAFRCTSNCREVSSASIISSVREEGFMEAVRVREKTYLEDVRVCRVMSQHRTKSVPKHLVRKTWTEEIKNTFETDICTYRYEDGHCTDRRDWLVCRLEVYSRPRPERIHSRTDLRYYKQVKTAPQWSKVQLTFKVPIPMPFSDSGPDPNVTSASFFFRFWISTTC